MIIDWKAHILPGLDRKCDSHVKAIQLMIYAKEQALTSWSQCRFTRREPI